MLQRDSCGTSRVYIWTTLGLNCHVGPPWACPFPSHEPSEEDPALTADITNHRLSLNFHSARILCTQPLSYQQQASKKGHGVAVESEVSLCSLGPLPARAPPTSALIAGMTGLAKSQLGPLPIYIPPNPQATGPGSPVNHHLIFLLAQ